MLSRVTNTACLVLRSLSYLSTNIFFSSLKKKISLLLVREFFFVRHISNNFIPLLLVHLGQLFWKSQCLLLKTHFIIYVTSSSSLVLKHSQKKLIHSIFNYFCVLSLVCDATRYRDPKVSKFAAMCSITKYCYIFFVETESSKIEKLTVA